MSKNPASRIANAPMKGLPRRAKLKQYLVHLEKLRHAKGKVDQQPLPLNINNYLRLYKMPSEFGDIMESLGYNKRLLIDLAGEFMKPRDSCAPVGKDVFLKATKNRVLLKQLEKIQTENYLLLANLTNIKHPQQPKPSSSATQQQPQSLVPVNILKKFGRIVEVPPKNITLLNKVFRPKIYFELEAKRERVLGRITFQLYTEACPALVLQLLRFLANGDCEKIRFPRLYLSLWAEGEVTVGAHNLDCAKYYDLQAVDCGSQAGTLSFAVQDYKILKQGILVFSINFRPITVNDGKHFAFGKLIGGRTRFLCLHEYGTKSGKPIKEINVTGMGIL